MTGMLWPSRIGARIGVRIACLIGVTSLLVVSTSSWPAHAHVEVVSSDPSDGSVLDSPPAAVTLVFSEPLSPEDSVVALRLDGAPARQLQVTGGPTLTALTVTVPTDVEVPVEAGLARWSLDYRAVGGDDHPVEGQLTFSAPASAAPDPPEATPPAERAGTAAHDEEPAAGSSGDTRSSPWQRPAAVLSVSGLALLSLIVFVTRRVRR